MAQTSETSDSGAPKSAAELKEAHEKQRDFLLEELKDVEKALETFKSDAANELREEATYRKNKLEHDELTFFLLYSTAKDIREFKERAEALITRQNPIKMIPAAVWFSIVPILIVLYITVLGILQWRYNSDLRIAATQTAQAMPTTTAIATSTPSP